MHLRTCPTPIVAFALAVAVAACSDPAPTGSRSQRENIHVLKLEGTPYQMGVQHGELMAEELKAGVEFVENDAQFSMLMLLAENGGYVDEAKAQSYPDVLDECRGMEEGSQRTFIGFSLDELLDVAGAGPPDPASYP